MPILWTVAGSVGYATLYCLAGSLISDRGWWSIILMAPSMLVSTVLAIALTPSSRRLMRQARPASRGWNIAKTVAHMALFTVVFLFLASWLFVELERRAGLPRIDIPHQRPVGILLFLMMTVLALWCGVTMARLGEGTLLPVDGPRRLVVRGPYAHVRNPMAITGIGQAMAVVVYTGSWLMLVYVLLGALIWQFVARPLEEEDLARHFGRAYEQYRDRVKCWLPRRGTYRPDVA